jgi:hypothetical protein
MLRSFNPKYIAFRRALSTEQYQSALIVGLLCWPLNDIPCLPELYYSADILFRNWLCLTEFDWCGNLDTGIYGNKEADALARAGALSSVGKSVKRKRAVVVT